MLPINCRYHCSTITKSIIDLRRETTALAQRCGITYSGRYCDSKLVRLELLCAVTSIRAARAHDQAKARAGGQALRMGASGREAATRITALSNDRPVRFERADF